MSKDTDNIIAELNKFVNDEDLTPAHNMIVLAIDNVNAIEFVCTELNETKEMTASVYEKRFIQVFLSDEYIEKIILLNPNYKNIKCRQMIEIQENLITKCNALIEEAKDHILKIKSAITDNE